MTDKELLELAAKAAELPVEFEEGNTNGWWPCGRDEYGDVVSFWNPLTDDGDALRLAVKLKMRVDVVDFAVYVWTLNGIVSIKESTTMGYGIEEATRRAIVRAAAEIGRTL